MFLLPTGFEPPLLLLLLWAGGASPTSLRTPLHTPLTQGGEKLFPALSLKLFFRERTLRDQSFGYSNHILILRRWYRTMVDQVNYVTAVTLLVTPGYTGYTVFSSVSKWVFQVFPAPNPATKNRFPAFELKPIPVERSSREQPFWYSNHVLILRRWYRTALSHRHRRTFSAVENHPSERPPP